MQSKSQERDGNGARKQATFYGESFAAGGRGRALSERRSAGAGDPEVDPSTHPTALPSRPVVVEVVLVVVVDGVARLAVTVSPAACRRPS